MRQANWQPLNAPSWFVPSSSALSIELWGALGSLGHMQAATVEATLRYQIEALQFLQNRLESDLHLLQHCQSYDREPDPFDVWSGFWQQTFLDYFKEGARLADIGTASMRKTAKRLHEEERRVVENMAAQATM